MPTFRSLRGRALEPDERTALLARYRSAWETAEAADHRGDPAALQVARHEMSAVAREYVAGVPIVSLSRCPFTGAVFETSLDIEGLDGLWWAYEHEYRPWVEPPPTFFAWTGALELDGPLPEWTLKEMVGPAAPFVLPRILEHPDVKAVLSSLLVGEHIGYPVVYFAQPVPHDLERVDDWGHRVHFYQRPDGSPTSAHAVEDDDEKDFDLGPWIDRGKLAWIAPGDLSLTLRTGREGCPYLGLTGERRRRYLQEGDTWLA